MNIKTLYSCARDEFNLPSYKKQEYKEFIARSYFADYLIRDYFSVPAVKCRLHEIEDVKDVVKVKISWEQSGDYVLVYPS